jgi:hypothetical protein
MVRFRDKFPDQPEPVRPLCMELNELIHAGILNIDVRAYPILAEYAGITGEALEVASPEELLTYNEQLDEFTLGYIQCFDDDKVGKDAPIWFGVVEGTRGTVIGVRTQRIAQLYEKSNRTAQRYRRELVIRMARKIHRSRSNEAADPSGSAR